DSRLTDNSQDALVRSLHSLSLHPNDIPIRPGWGNSGQPIKLRTNFFPVKVPRDPLFEYDVTISPQSGTALKRIRRRIFQLAESSREWAASGLRGQVAHDHSSKLISARELPQPLVVVVPFYEEDEDGPQPDGKEYKLTVNFVQTLDTTNLLR